MQGTINGLNKGGVVSLSQRPSNGDFILSRLTTVGILSCLFFILSVYSNPQGKVATIAGEQ